MTIKISKDLNPVDYYNHNHIEDAVNLLLLKNKSAKIVDNRLIEVDGANNEICHIKYINGGLMAEDSCSFLDSELLYSPFMILTKFQFKGNYIAATASVNHKYLSKEMIYMRVGVDYLKVVKNPDRYGIERTELRRWKKEEIVQDMHGKWILNHIPRYDGFTIAPSNVNYQAVVHNHYNLYAPFEHQPKKGDWTWTERLLRHVFGQDEVEFQKGIKYLWCLYMEPKQILPILVLTSKERATGKTTFVSWLSTLFGANMSVINPEDLKSQFNSSYARSNVIAIEETTQDRASLVEKLKMLSTTEMLNFNAKFRDAVNVPFFGHFIITTNDDDKFMKVDKNEIRFYVLGLSKPKYFDAKIIKHLVKEIPAFLYHLRTIDAPDLSLSRMVFTPEELDNKLLNHVKDESKSWLYKEIREKLEDFFYDWEKIETVQFTPYDLKRKFFSTDNKAEINYIRRVLKNEFELTPTEGTVRYIPFEGTLNQYSNKRIGRVYVFDREQFVAPNE